MECNHCASAAYYAYDFHAITGPRVGVRSRYIKDARMDDAGFSCAFVECHYDHGLL